MLGPNTSAISHHILYTRALEKQYFKGNISTMKFFKLAKENEKAHKLFVHLSSDLNLLFSGSTTVAIMRSQWVIVSSGLLIASPHFS